MTKRKKKSLTLASIGLMGALILSACGNDSEGAGSEEKKSEEKAYTVGITQIVEHESLDQATKGFQDALKDEGLNVEYDIQIAQGDQNNNQTIANNFVGDKVDLIFANSTPSALGALNATDEIPIIFTSVTDPLEVKLVESFEKPGGNVTGTTDKHPEAIANTLKFIKENFPGKKVGTVYNAGEPNSVLQVEEMREAAKELGLEEPVESTVATSADVKQAAESLIGKADVIYIITDNTVVAALDSVIQVAADNAMPLFVGELDSVRGGGFAAYGFEYYDIGYDAGLMAAQILKGEKQPSELPVLVPQNLQFLINKSAAKEMKIELKEEWNDQAEFVE